MKFSNTVLSCLQIAHIACEILQETYYVIPDCANRVPPSSTTFLAETISDCAKGCQKSLVCLSFGYNVHDGECVLSRDDLSRCADLETSVGALSYKKEKSDLAELVPDLYFPFDEIQDGKILGDIEATAHNNPTLVDGVSKKALSFNGVDQWADLGTHACLSDITECSNGYTMTIWVKAAHQTGDETYILSSGGQTKNVETGGISVRIENGFILTTTFRLRSSQEMWKVTDIEIEADQWFHLGVTWHKDGVLIVYINGEEKSQTGPEQYNLGGNLVIDSFMHIGKPNNADLMHGEIQLDEWLFWQRVLSPHEVELVYARY